MAPPQGSGLAASSRTSTQSVHAAVWLTSKPAPIVFAVEKGLDPPTPAAPPEPPCPLTGGYAIASQPLSFSDVSLLQPSDTSNPAATTPQGSIPFDSSSFISKHLRPKPIARPVLPVKPRPRRGTRAAP
jgi:hypothetical protein